MRRNRLLIIKNKVRQYRRAKDLSQRELGELIGLSKMGVFAIEHGITTPKDVTVMKLLEVFKVELKELFYF